MSRRVYLFVIASILLAGIVSACSSDEQPLPTPTKTPAPLVSADTAQPQVQGPTVTPAQFMTPTPEIIAFGPDNFPENVNPLTGLTVDDPSTLARRPVVIVVSNSPPDFTRPQAGLGSADVVYEYFTEGGVTRYAAVFLTQAPDFVGSVRSCRLIMLELSLMYDALWGCSGYSTGVGERIRSAPNYFLLIDGTFFGAPYLRRVNEENVAVVPEAPHNLFAIPEEIWTWAEERDYNRRADIEGLAFHSQAPQGGVVATRVTVDYRGLGFRPRWDFDPASGTYLRFDESQPYVDKLTDEQLGFENVLVISAPEVITEIIEDSSGARAIEQQIWGEGPLTLFRDGMRFEGRWQRPNRSNMMTYTDLDGNTLALKPGQTWVQVVPSFFDRITVEP